ncbi:LysM peptidoglycan-binding domain-containing protein [Promicromonospora sp. NPDC052451]|uniref:LysM peptidoglycan-binding domain-containing protein n=1 Tax=Promicromonospora sp. NPDC052451 TaxID=3364407 RepID=UPI0037CC156A
MHLVHRTAAALAAAALSLAAAAAVTPAAGLTAAPTVPASVVAGPAAAAPVAAHPVRAAGDEDVKYYVVQASPDGTPEFLFELAERFLGDGNRYMEIFELNEGRTQPDGNKVTKPEILVPGWVLEMPADAKGEGIETGPLPAGVSEPGEPAGGASEPAAGEQSAAPEVPYYIVATTPEGEPEFLYGIAEKLLGDGERYREIFELNKGREQPDGQKMTTEDVVEVGWVLQMPEDAEGEGLQHGPLPVAGQESAPASSPATTPSADETTGGSADIVPIVVGVAAVVVLLVGSLVAYVLLRRRTKGGEPFDDSLLRTDTSSAWMVDRALRVLVAACERDGLPVPGIAAVFIEGSALRVRLSNPATPAPAPWVANEDGASWSAPLGRLQADPASTDPTSRFSRLVTVGVADTGRVLVDFGQARGLISLDGPTRARHEVLRRWLGEFTGNPWSDDPRVVMVGNGLPQAELAEHLNTVEQLVPELESEAGGVLVLSQAPSVSQVDMLAARFANPRFSWVVIVLGAVPTAKWRFTADDAGWLRSGFLPEVRYNDATSVRRAGE